MMLYFIDRLMAVQGLVCYLVCKVIHKGKHKRVNHCLGSQGAVRGQRQQNTRGQNKEEQGCKQNHQRVVHHFYIMK